MTLILRKYSAAILLAVALIALAYLFVSAEELTPRIYLPIVKYEIPMIGEPVTNP